MEPNDLWGVALRIVALVVGLLVMVLVVVTALPLVILLLLAVIVATGVGPLVDRIQHWTGRSRPLAVLLLYLGGLLLLLLIGALAVSPVIQGLQQAVKRAPEYPDQILQRLSELRRQFPFLPPVDQQAGGPLKDLGNQVGGVAGQALPAAGGVLGTAAGLLSLGLVLLFTTHFVVDGGRMREYLVSFLPPARQPQARALATRMAQRMGAWLLGQVTLSLLMGLASFVGLSLLRVPDALLFGVLGFFGEFVPMVGFMLVGLLAVLVALIQSPLQSVGTLVLYVGLQQLESNFLYPRIVGRAVRLHPFALVLAILLASTWLGVVGTVLAVPVAAAVAVSLDELRRAVAASSLPLLSSSQAATAPDQGPVAGG
jgi:putative heme transporter